MSIFQTAPYELECGITDLCSRMSAIGIALDVPQCHALLGDLETVQADLSAELQLSLPPKVTEEIFIPKRNNATKGYVTGVPINRRKEEPRNPNSTQQMVEFYQTHYGWQPTQLTDGGDPALTLAVLSTMDYPEAKIQTKLKLASKRISMITGERGWLNSVEAGRLHTNYSPHGTVTGRATHSPNIAQVPAILKTKAGDVLHGADGNWGFECRNLFSAPPPFQYLVGADQQGLELRCLGDQLYPYDGGAYSRLVCEGDVHEATREAAGLDSRSVAKRLGYAIVYGCGDLKAGTIVEPDEADQDVVRFIGKETKRALIAGIPGFKDLFRWLDTLNNSELPGLDGRILYARKKHTRLNTLLQSTGSILCKRWLLLIDEDLQRQGLRAGSDYEFVAWIHDETQIATRDYPTAEIVAASCNAMAIQSGLYYGFHCPTAGTATIGRTWAETH